MKDLSAFGNDMYNIFKMLPALAIAIVLDKFEKAADNEFYLYLMAEVNTKAPFSRLIKWIIRCIETDISAHMRLEIAEMEMKMEMEVSRIPCFKYGLLI